MNGASMILQQRAATRLLLLVCLLVLNCAAQPLARLALLDHALSCQALPSFVTADDQADKGTPDEARAKYAAKYVEEVAGALKAAEAGLVDDVIDPTQTRKLLAAALEMLFSKRDSNPAKKHGNMPL